MSLKYDSEGNLVLPNPSAGEALTEIYRRGLHCTDEGRCCVAMMVALGVSPEVYPGMVLGDKDGNPVE